MCDCIKNVNALLADHNTALLTTMFRPADVCVVATFPIKARGKKAKAILATFCPFCGEKYPATTPQESRANV